MVKLMGPNRKLTELNPRLKGDILVFECPCNRCKDIREHPEAEANKLFCDGLIRIPILPQPNGWSHSGGEFPETISLQPSILIGNSAKNKNGGCEGWHGYLTNGILTACE